MAINQAIKDVSVFAQNGDKQTPVEAGITTAGGWPLAAEQVGGMNVSRRLFNELLFRLTSAFAYFRDAGTPPEWDSRVDYIHDSTGIAFCRGSDGTIYRSVQASGPTTGNAANPVTDTARQFWRIY